jgi:hypothetical protein
MSEKLRAFRAATASLTKDTPADDAKTILRNAKVLMVDLTPTELEDALEYIKERCSLPGEWVKAFRVELKEARKKSSTGAGNGRGKPAFTAMLPNLVDLVNQDGTPVFLMKTEDQGLTIAQEWEVDGSLYAPPPLQQIPWLLPRADEVQKWYAQNESIGILYDDTVAYHKGISELPSEAHYDLLVAWDFHTYLPEPCQYSPEICFYAVPERGKSRTGKGMIYIARRGVHVESLRDAYLVRLANDFEATIFFDVMDLWKKAERMGCEDIILGRFERGIVVPRVLYPERGPHQDTVYYKIFGPTIIATNVQVHKILDTRAIQTNMPQTNKQFETDVTPKAALVLKERLTAWRAHHLGENLPDILKPAGGRLGDITKPLLQILSLVRPERVPDFLTFISEIERNRMIDKSDSLEAQILLVMDSLKDKVEGGILPVKTITEAFNDGKPESAHLTWHRIGRKLWGLGFDKGSTGKGASAVVWNEEKFVKIYTAYGLGKTSEMSETSEIPDQRGIQEPDVSDQSDVSDVCSAACEEKNLSFFSEENIERVVI